LQPGGKVYLFGWSMGGAVALDLARREPVDGVVTLGAFSRLADVAPGYARPFLPDRFDNLAAIRQVRAPVYLFHGTHDAIVPYAHAARLKAASGGRATVVTLNGAGHHLEISTIEQHVWRALEGRGGPEAR
jgi:pimeloyl-ACP methyl ester carboxylesterase